MVDKIKARTANGIYDNYHSYMNGGRQGKHYGVFLDGALVGSISFNTWPSSSKIKGYQSEQIREVVRVCIANETPNLASCAMSKAQDMYTSEIDDEIKLLVTYVRSGYDGTMFKPLRGKGWEFDRRMDGHQPGNHPNQDIYGYEKDRWICEL